MNALVGGGSFVTLPTLLAAGLTSVEANASSAVALYPGGALSAFVYRNGLSSVCGVPLTLLVAASVSGGCAGALLLLWTPTSVFDRLLPWLLLLATVMLAFGSRLAPVGGTRGGRSERLTVVSAQFILGIYGGYFGGAVGIMMLATWGMLGARDLKALSAPRTLLVTAANTAAIVCLMIGGVVHWPEAAPVCGGALVGGYAGARVGQRLPSLLVRVVTVGLTVSMTLLFFRRAYW
jgi:uncharacterized membrane protein YfcA